MTRFHVRSLTSRDFEALRRLEADIYDDPALVGGRPVGSLLCFVRERAADDTTLAVRPEFQRPRVTPRLPATSVKAVKPDELWDFGGPGDERIVSKIDHPRFETLRDSLAPISCQAVRA